MSWCVPCGRADAVGLETLFGATLSRPGTCLGGAHGPTLCCALSSLARGGARRPRRLRWRSDRKRPITFGRSRKHCTHRRRRGPRDAIRRLRGRRSALFPERPLRLRRARTEAARRELRGDHGTPRRQAHGGRDRLAGPGGAHPIEQVRVRIGHRQNPISELVPWQRRKRHRPGGAQDRYPFTGESMCSMPHCVRSIALSA